MARWRRTRGAGHEDGASAVEFALIVPILVLLVSAIIGFGFVFAQQLALGNAARQAARAAAVSGPFCGTGGAVGSTGTELTGQAKVDATTIAVTTNNVKVAIKKANAMPTDWTTGLCSGSTAQACETSVAGDNVYVRLEYLSTLNLPFMRPSFTLSSIGAFRCEFSSL